jgi:hypothetical protein
LKRPARRWRSRGRILRESWHVQRETWAVERDIEDAVQGSGPLLVGPWTGEVGYEVLYWVPFLRWLSAAYRLPATRLIAVSRGGAGSWYSDIAGTYVDALELMTPEAFADRARSLASDTRTAKQLTLSDLDREIASGVTRRVGADVRLVHPSLMYRLFRAFWSGHAPMSFLERYTRFTRVTPPAGADLSSLPPEYVCAKFYTARALPADPSIRATLRSIVSGLATRTPVVMLDTNVRMDEHEDFSFDGVPNVMSARGLMTPATNLAVQSQIIAGARAFVGTCGSVAWLAPMLGVDTVPLLADAGFLHAHLHVARRAFHRMAGAGSFSPCDIGAVTRLGLTVSS